tara:strand:+ start:201 stop:527 length:327 start_codon:yes stop_codon:yes gene_type:complete
MDCVIQETVEGVELKNVVNQINWKRLATEGTEGEANYYYADVYGVMSLTSPDPNDFVLYENLTEADVDAWLNKMNEPRPSQIDEQLAKNINLQKNPVEETLPLPWSNE